MSSMPDQVDGHVLNVEPKQFARKNAKAPSIVTIAGVKKSLLRNCHLGLRRGGPIGGDAGRMGLAWRKSSR
jgi:hypothetical protein